MPPTKDTLARLEAAGANGLWGRHEVLQALLGASGDEAAALANLKRSAETGGGKAAAEAEFESVGASAIVLKGPAVEPSCNPSEAEVSAQLRGNRATTTTTTHHDHRFRTFVKGVVVSGVTANWKAHEDFARDFLAQFERGTPGTFTAKDGAVAQQFRQPWEPFRATPPAGCVRRPVTLQQ